MKVYLDSKCVWEMFIDSRVDFAFVTWFGLNVLQFTECNSSKLWHLSPQLHLKELSFLLLLLFLVLNPNVRAAMGANTAADRFDFDFEI